MSGQEYIVPDIIDLIYNDVIYGLYSRDNNHNKINRVKIVKCNLACDFLINSELTEEEISLKLDLPSVVDFRELFFYFMNINPLEFRQRFKN